MRAAHVLRLADHGRAEQVRILLEEDYPQARNVRLVCDNRNTHPTAAMYEAFPAEHERALVKRLEIHHTPVHGRWLNVSEVEWGVLARQCLDRRIGSAQELEAEVASRVEERNAGRSQVVWKFTNDKARV